MKKLTIAIYQDRSKQQPYYILIPPHNRVYFSTKKEAEKHSRLLKKLLFDNVTILCSIQVKVYSLYYQYYTQLSSLTAEKIRFNLHSFDKQVDYVFKLYSQGNQSFIFSKLQLLFALVETSVVKLLNFAKSKNSHANLINQVNSILKELEVFNKYYESELFNTNNSISYRKPLVVVFNSKSKLCINK